ncbi:MAG: stage II sporulation protein D [Oscillospiraceae bacterium]|nr:stage II sporulation protein D [Oscillospiraceae bacterium]
MKRYLIWLGVVYILLLLFPLPLLGKSKPDKANSSSSSGRQVSSTTQKSNKIDDTFRLLNTKTGKVIELTARDFLIGAVGAELYPTFHTEAIKAQAVASYTYYNVLRNRQRTNPDKSLNGADFADKQADLPIYYNNEQLKERWGANYDTYHKKIGDAVNAVLGKLITYDNEPITAVYHAISSGTTEDAAVVWGTSYPYLQPVATPGDKISPQYQSITTFTPDELSTKLGTVKDVEFTGSVDTWLGNDIQTSTSGTVTYLTICKTPFTGREIREALGLRSACFTVKFQNGNFQFTVLGYGHNVGMSQYGADYLARQGMTYDEILRYYYTGVEIT